jgi:hypothetical protein
MSQPCTHTSHLNLWGAPIYAYSQTWYQEKTFDVVSGLYTHAFLPNFWVIHTYVHSKTIHLNKSNHRYNSVANASMKFQTFGELMYTSTPNI